MRRFTSILTSGVLNATLIVSSLQVSIAAPIHVMQPQFDVKTDQTILKIGHRMHRHGKAFSSPSTQAFQALQTSSPA